MPARKAKKRTTRKTRKTKALTPVLGRSELSLPADMEDEFSKYVNRDKASATSAGWPYASTQGSTPVMTCAGAKLGNARGGPELEAIVLGGNRVNSFYQGEFTPGKPTPPSCYAIADPDWESGEVEAKLRPPADLASKEHDDCAGCPQNAFGSGRGNSKACKNTVRLALLPADAKDYSKADGLMLSVPPTSLRAWSSYVGQWTAINRPVMTVVTEIAKIPNEKGAGFALRFEKVRPISDRDDLHALLSRAAGDGAAALVQPPPTAAADEKGSSTGPRRRKVVKKGRR